MTPQLAICPSCRQTIPLADVNVATDMALCRTCEKPYNYSEVVEKAVAGGVVDLTRPPAGARFVRNMHGFEVSVSTRSALAIFLVPFMCVWSGGSLGGIYGSQVMQGRFDLMRSLFGVPFLIGTVIFGSLALMAVAGRVQVQVEGNDGSVFIGVGPVGWRRRFHWREITAVRLTQIPGRNGLSEQLSLEGQSKLNIGTGMTSARRYFLLAALRQMLRERR